ncbi:MAG: ribonuclease III [Phycisphaerae bacterium]|jgi:ribonuclease-3|nr:ribonuclease III [Phycisphaerae bacterium]
MSDVNGVLEICQQRISYRFNDPALLKAALTHASLADHRADSNERLEFLGDAVLGLVLCHALFERLPQAMEGDLTKIKSAVVSRRTCAQVACRLGLPEVLRCGQGMEVGDRMPRSLAAAALEALIAAIYLDGGFDTARDFILRNMNREIDEAVKSEHQFNFKSQLQQYAQRVKGLTPSYELLDEKGPDHAKCFEVAVSIGSRYFPSAWGPSKKEAEQKAAWLALVALGELKDDAPYGESSAADHCGENDERR